MLCFHTFSIDRLLGTRVNTELLILKMGGPGFGTSEKGLIKIKININSELEPRMKGRVRVRDQRLDCRTSRMTTAKVDARYIEI